MSSRVTAFEAFEPRRFFTFTTFNESFGAHGAVAVGPAQYSAAGKLFVGYDGGSIVQTDNDFRRLDGNGRFVTTFGGRGVIDLKGSTHVIQVAVDPANGRIAMIVSARGVDSLDIHHPRWPV